MVGDGRITDIYRDSSERLLSKLSQDNASKPDHHFCLSKLPGQLKQLSGRTLKSMVTAIVKDM